MNPPRTKPVDENKYREQYLNNLRVEASTTQLNANANAIFKKTGQTPTQPTDTRTTTEKHDDIEKVKIELRSGLSNLTDGTNANDIVNSLTDNEILFALAQLPAITADLKPKFALGIPAVIFVNYLKKLRQKFMETKGVDYGLQQSTGNAILLSNQQILGQMIGRDDLNELKTEIQQIPAEITQNPIIRQVIQTLFSEITELQNSIPSREELEAVSRLPADTVADIRRLLNDSLEDIPRKADIQRLMEELLQAGERDDEERTGAILEDLSDLLRVPPSFYEQLDAVRAELDRAGGESPADLEFSTPNQSRTPVPQSKELVPRTPQRPIDTIYTTNDSPIINSGRITSWDSFKELSLAEKKQFLTNNRQIADSLVDSKGKKLSVANLSENGEVRGWRATNLQNLIESWLERGGSGNGLIKGRGFSRRVSKEGGIPKAKSYIPFGRYVINKQRLVDDICMIRSPKGGVVPDLPTAKVSSKIGAILRILSNGAIPDFEMIAALNESDKQFLYKVSKQAHILDRFAAPKPNKDAEAKEMDRFEILKGEIQAGNDSKTLVKEFKVMLLRFIHSNRIPRRQGQEILTELTAMGL